MVKENNREEFVIKVGPLMREILDKQKKNVNEISYECVNPSDYEAGEIIAKKIIQKKLV